MTGYFITAAAIGAAFAVMAVWPSIRPRVRPNDRSEEGDQQ
ncbi:hypothetical protein [Streptomyces vilmorinianum]|nr:hypothetical protein [Streptomyces vilmorinianum]